MTAIPSAGQTAPPEEQVVERLAVFFETLQPSSVQGMGEFYTADAYFKDPFNEVHGLADIQRIFSHMYVALDQPHFVVTDRVVQGSQCFLVWDFRFHFKRFDTTTLHTVRGTSHLRFAPDGRVNYHRDDWDAAQELYDKLPLIGSLMRWFKKRVNS